MSLISVDLPLPVDPITAVTSPGEHLKEMLLMTFSSAPSSSGGICAEGDRRCEGFLQIVCRDTNFDRLNPDAERGVSKVCCRVFCREPLYRYLKPQLMRFDFLASEAGENHVYCPRLHS